jgi:integrase/recombinase XerC
MSRASPAKPAAANDAVLDSFLQSLRDRAVSPCTLRNYSHALNEFHRWQTEQAAGKCDWAKLDRDSFRAYLRFLGRQNLSRAAIHLRFSALRSFYKFLVRKGSVESVPLKGLSLPKLQKRLPQFLTAEQMSSLLQAPLLCIKISKGPEATRKARFVALRDLAALETLYSCGMRITELCSLQAADLDIAEQVVRVRGKGKKERLVPIGKPALDAIFAFWNLLPARPRESEPVFRATEKKKTAMSNRLLQLRLKTYLAAVGLDPKLTPHKLRHSYATHMLDAGADLRSVQELLGHAHLITTQVYTHITTDRLKKAYDQAHPRA